LNFKDMYPCTVLISHLFNGFDNDLKCCPNVFLNRDSPMYLSTSKLIEGYLESLNGTGIIHNV